MKRKLIAILLPPALLLAWIGIFIIAFRIHPVLSGVTLFVGLLGYGASHDWFNHLHGPRA
jgi:hypothetical protein